MNDVSLLSERRQIAAELLEHEKELIIDRSYNPISKEYMMLPEEIVYDIPPELDVIKALNLAKDKKEGSHQLKADLKSVINGCDRTIKKLRMSRMKIMDVRRRHILAILGQVACDKGSKWTNNQFNYYRATSHPF